MVFQSFSNPIKYGYGTGRVKVLETRLLTRQRLERLIAAENFEELQRILAETDYGPFLKEAASVEEIEERLESYLAQLYHFLNEVKAPPKLITFFRCKYDFHNLKIFLKSKIPAYFPQEATSTLGEIDLNFLKGAVHEEKWEKLPSPYFEASKKSWEAFLREKDSQSFEVYLDQAYYGLLLQIARELKNSFLIKLTKTLIDLANLRLFCRVEESQKPEEFLTLSLLEEGLIEREQFIFSYQQEEGEFFLSKALARAGYTSLASNILNFGKEIFVEDVDLLAEDYFMEFISQARYVAVGMEPIVGYILARESEVRLLRIVLFGHLNNVPKEVVHKRMRKLYA